MRFLVLAGAKRTVITKQQHTCLRGLVLALVILAPHAAGRDPQDGPHADLRIRIDDERVRFNLILNLAFVDEIVDVPRESPDALYVVERELLFEVLEEHLRESIGVTIDEVEVTPRFVEFDAPEPELELLPLFPRTGMRALLRLRFVIDYPTEKPPRIVTLRWGDYPPDPILATPDETPSLEVAALISGYGEDRLVRFREDEPEYTWRSRGRSLGDLFRSVPAPPTPARLELSVPTIALAGLYLICLGAGAVRGSLRRVLAFLPLALGGGILCWGFGRVSVAAPFGGGVGLDRETACSVLRPLIANVYRAFDYDEEGDIYDALARSVAGDLLDELYQRTYESLVYQEAGGAVARVRSVEVVECALTETRFQNEVPTMDLDATWRVEGGVYHWGHTHSRLNEYRARFEVAAVDGAWRIIDDEVLSAERLDATPEGGFEEADEPDEWISPDQEF